MIEPLCNLSRKIAGRLPERLEDKQDFESYSLTQDMINATLDSLVRFKELLGRPSIGIPNFTHVVTLTEVLMNLEDMGYPELARAGH